ncbi:MAG: anti-sigma F factor [Clostridia bacterium]|nr:anti-sigma F factor [Clostridiales bacterium]MDD7166556.1 anti-sigma F factor [Clostridia bacterium]MDY2900929.1 anti-sigma F factor [Christensenellaceae bacterium]
MKNRMLIKFDSVSENEGFARNVIASFLLPLNPGIGELTDIKTAVSEAVTNAIVHGYPDAVGEVTMLAETDGENVHIVISDSGVGIDDLEAALEPFYTTKPDDERSGMGFTIIKTFMDEVKVISKQNVGTIVDMTKRLSSVA